jgi:hypothetical protein
MYFFLFLHYYLSSKSKRSPQHTNSTHPQFLSSTEMEDKVYFVGG